MSNDIIKWVPNQQIMTGLYEMKYIKDEFSNLSICLLNKNQTIIIKWEGIVESYSRSIEESRFRFISKDWQKTREKFQDWTFFQTKKSELLEKIYSEYIFTEKEQFTHYMIVTSNFIIDIVSSFEPKIIIK